MKHRVGHARHAFPVVFPQRRRGPALEEGPSASRPVALCRSPTLGNPIPYTTISRWTVKNLKTTNRYEQKYTKHGMYPHKKEN